MSTPGRLLLGAALLACFGISQSQTEQSKPGWLCLEDASRCIGTIQLEVTKAFWPEAEGSFEIQKFSNGEELLINRASGDAVKFLKLPNETGAFYGVRGEEAFWRQNEIFQQGLGRALWLTHAVIASAYPQGIETMHAEWTPRRIEFEGKQVDIYCRKSSATTFEFRFAIGHHWNVSGLWRLEKVIPLPDEYSLVGWSGAGQRTYRTLGDLRRAHLPRKP